MVLKKLSLLYPPVKKIFEPSHCGLAHGLREVGEAHSGKGRNVDNDYLQN
jgi:hypothetical protein